MSFHMSVMMLVKKNDEDDDDNEVVTGKLHLVIDNTEAEHIRIRHQHFLVLTKMIRIIISIINITTTIMIMINLERVIPKSPAGGQNSLHSPDSVHRHKTPSFLRN